METKKKNSMLRNARKLMVVQRKLELNKALYKEQDLLLDKILAEAVKRKNGILTIQEVIKVSAKKAIQIKANCWDEKKEMAKAKSFKATFAQHYDVAVIDL